MSMHKFLGVHYAQFTISFTAGKILFELVDPSSWKSATRVSFRPHTLSYEKISMRKHKPLKETRYRYIKI